MRKLLAAGIIAAGSLGASVQANAESTIYEISGTFGSNEQGCTQISLLFGGSDCSFGRNRPGAQVDGQGVPTWIGPQFSGGHYVADGQRDIISFVPKSGVFDPVAFTFSPAENDFKVAAPITGTFAIDDSGTPADPTDDLISAQFTIGAMARNIATGQSTRAVQRWDAMDHVMAPTAVNATATVANGVGGADYVIGSRGFPTPRCSATNNADCYPTSNSSPDFDNFDASDNPVAFWAQIAPNSVGIERSTLMGNPDYVTANPKPPANPPSGNVGASTDRSVDLLDPMVFPQATFTGYSCSDSQANDLDCTSNSLVWQNAGAGTGGEPAGFDNLVMKISTNGAGDITSALIYWTEEYFIGFGGPPAGYDNSWQGGTISFTGQIIQPRANDFAQSVLVASTGNVLDTVSNSVNFPGAITVSIVSGPNPALGTATVGTGAQANQIIYDSIAGAGTDTIVYQATDGIATDTGTITITVEPDISPTAPDGAITSISTLGSTPGNNTGTVNVATLVDYSPGNPPSTAAASGPAPTRGTVTQTGPTTFRYTPAATFFSGVDTFGYTITDDQEDTDSGVITVTIPDLNPSVADGALTTDQDTQSAALPLAINPGNGAVSDHDITVTTNGASGSCAVSGTSLTYTPAPGFFGTDSCVVTITDGDATQPDTGTISITVNEVSNQLKLPGGGGAIDLWSLSLLGALPLLRRRRRA